MAGKPYDVIVVGARCAGSPTAMLLARKGYRVLVLDKATFPSDTVSTHLIHPPGVTALRRWGLLEPLIETGCPPIDTYAFDFGPFTLSGAPGAPAASLAYAPRRTVLDKLLVDAASEAGAEVRQGFTAEEILVEDGRVAGIRGRETGGLPVTERARIVVGADGLHSLVAKAVRPEQYREKPRLLAAYYTYWSGLPMGGRLETYIRPYRSFAAWPTGGELTILVAGWPYAEMGVYKRDIEGNYLKTVGLIPSFAERIRGARRESRFFGMAVPNYFRKPFGPGWVLVGDAGYNKDFITAQGITDAFIGAEHVATALDGVFSGGESFDVAMGRYQSARDAHALPIYEYTAQLASQEPPPPEFQRLLQAIRGSQLAMDGFAQAYAGVVSPAEFFSEENVGRIFAAAR